MSKFITTIIDCRSSDALEKLLHEAANQREALIMRYLNEFIGSGLLKVVDRAYVLVRCADSDEVELKTRCEVVLPELLTDLQNKNKELSARLDKIKEAVRKNGY